MEFEKCELKTALEKTLQEYQLKSIKPVYITNEAQFKKMDNIAYYGVFEGGKSVALSFGNPYAAVNCCALFNRFRGLFYAFKGWEVETAFNMPKIQDDGIYNYGISGVDNYGNVVLLKRVVWLDLDTNKIIKTVQDINGNTYFSCSGISKNRNIQVNVFNMDDVLVFTEDLMMIEDVERRPVVTTLIGMK